MKKHQILILCSVTVLILFSLIITSKWDTIFQRGNPLPYLVSMFKLSDDHTYEAVAGLDGTYVTRRGKKEDLFQMIQDTYHVEWKDQIGSGYLFSDGVQNYIVGSEIYWGWFTVWTLPFEDGV